MKSTKIRGMRFNLHEQDNQFQCVIPGMSPSPHNWHYSEGVAKTQQRFSIDARAKMIDQFDSVDRADGPGNVVIERGMEDYSGWGVAEHCEWVGDCTGLDGKYLTSLVSIGFVIVTDEAVDAVHLFAFNHNNSPAKQIF